MNIKRLTPTARIPTYATDGAACFDLYAAPLTIKPGDRIAQAMVVPVGRVQFTEVDELGTTARGTGGFGSTGV